MSHIDLSARRLPPATGDLEELRALQGQIALIRREMSLTFGDPSRAMPFPPWWAVVGAVVLGVVGSFGLLVAATAVFGGESTRFLVAGGSVAVVSFVALVVLWRVKVSPVERRRFGRNREAKQHHLAVLARNAVLWEQLRPQPAPDLPLPPDRQPSHFAMRMHARRGGDADPETALRALPADASSLRVWYLRHLGRGGALTLLLVAAVLAAFGARVVWELTG